MNVARGTNSIKVEVYPVPAQIPLNLIVRFIGRVFDGAVAGKRRTLHRDSLWWRTEAGKQLFVSLTKDQDGDRRCKRHNVGKEEFRCAPGKPQEPRVMPKLLEWQDGNLLRPDPETASKVDAWLLETKGVPHLDDPPRRCAPRPISALHASG